jgi:hypothetical protein
MLYQVQRANNAEENFAVQTIQREADHQAESVTKSPKAVLKPVQILEEVKRMTGGVSEQCLGGPFVPRM